MSLLPIRIFEYDRDTGVLTLTENVPLVPELKAIADKYPGDAGIPYFVYVHMLSSFDSPFANVDEEEREEAVIFDIHQLYPGKFDPDEPLLKPAVERCAGAYDSSIVLLAKEMEQELHRIRKTLRDNPIVLGGENANFKERTALLEKMEKIVASHGKVKKQAEEEIKVKMKGKSQLGEY